MRRILNVCCSGIKQPIIDHQQSTTVCIPPNYMCNNFTMSLQSMVKITLHKDCHHQTHRNDFSIAIGVILIVSILSGDYFCRVGHGTCKAAKSARHLIESKEKNRSSRVKVFSTRINLSHQAASGKQLKLALTIYSICFKIIMPFIYSKTIIKLNCVWGMILFLY